MHAATLEKRMRPESRGPAALCALLLTLALGCANVSVRSDYDPEADFAPYRTYTWLQNPPENTTQSLDPQLHDRILAEVETQLGERGYVRIFEGSPDFRIGYHLRVGTKLDVETINRTYGYGYGRYWRWSNVHTVGGYSETRVTEYAQGTFILDVVDGRSNELVWRGLAEGRMRDAATPKERDEAVRETVAAVLEKFPPESSS